MRVEILVNYNFGMDNDTKLVKEFLKIQPTYFLKLSSNFKNVFPKLNSNKFKNSNALFVIALSKRKYIIQKVKI